MCMTYARQTHNMGIYIMVHATEILTVTFFHVSVAINILQHQNNKGGDNKK